MINIAINIFHPRDYIFYKDLLNKFKTKKYKFIFIVFLDEKIIEDKNFQYIYFYKFNDFNILKKNSLRKISFKKEHLFHEQFLYKKNYTQVLEKFELYISKISSIIEKHKIQLIMQEIGGMVAHVSCFYATKLKKINNIFIEPSLVKSHSLFLLNTMALEKSIIVNSLSDAKKIKYKYIQGVINKSLKVHNEKDQHYFSENSFLNIFIKKYYLFSFFRKIKNNIYANKSEFNNLLFHLSKILLQLKNYFFFSKKNISKLENLKNYIYFPLHVQNDFALTLRAKSCLDQVKVLKKKIILSKDDILVFKEHPLSPYSYNYKKIINCNKQFFFVKHSYKSFNVIENSKLVITINSKSGVEAMVMGKPVFCLVNNYYCGKGLATLIKKKIEIKKINKNIKKYLPDKKKLSIFLDSIFKKTIFFSLYDLADENLIKSRKNLLKILNILY